jgi:hypothetical protein
MIGRGRHRRPVFLQQAIRALVDVQSVQRRHPAVSPSPSLFAARTGRIAVAPCRDQTAHLGHGATDPGASQEEAA